MKRVRVEHFLLAGILLIGLSVRLWGVDFGLPYLYHPDEPRRVAIAQDMFKTGDLNPRFLRYPTLFIYVNALAYVPYYQFGKLLGFFDSPAEILPPVVLTTGLGQAPLPSAILMGRLISVLFGVATIGLVFLIGKRLHDKPWVGLLAALMVAVSPTNVADSRYVTPDTSLAFLILVVVWASLRILQQGKSIDYIVAGCAAGLAASSKYPGALAMVVPMAAHFLQPGTKGIKDYKLFLVLVLAPVAFLATSPFA
ncbi:ArnT family glycosyltransferase, partial [Chloroflexota bacterium]